MCHTSNEKFLTLNFSQTTVLYLICLLSFICIPHTHTCTHTCTHVHAHVHTHVHTYTHMYTQTQHTHRHNNNNTHTCTHNTRVLTFFHTTFLFLPIPLLLQRRACSFFYVKNPIYHVPSRVSIKYMKDLVQWRTINIPLVILQSVRHYVGLAPTKLIH